MFSLLLSLPVLGFAQSEAHLAAFQGQYIGREIPGQNFDFEFYWQGQSLHVAKLAGNTRTPLGKVLASRQTERHGVVFTSLSLDNPNLEWEFTFKQTVGGKAELVVYKQVEEMRYAYLCAPASL